jgi:type IV pilus assembly protein PilV
MKFQNNKRIHYQTGISLIEVLITTLILGIGLLGVAALQISGITSNLEGFYTSQASALAEELSARMRTSKISTMIVASPSRDRIAYESYLNFYAEQTSNAGAIANPIACEIPPTSCRSKVDNTPTPECTMMDLATFDLQDICSIAKNTLPNPNLRLVRTNNLITIIIDWDSNTNQSLGTQSNVNRNCRAYTGSTNRNCILMVLTP